MAASVGYTFRRRCDGGGHFVLGVSFNGVALGDYVYTTDEVRAPLSELTQEERELVARVILRLRLQGMTRAEINTLFQAGPVVIQIG